MCNAAGVCETIVCTPDCTGAECGDDGCGGGCGTCGPGYTCGGSSCDIQLFGASSVVHTDGETGTECHLAFEGDTLYWASDEWLYRIPGGGAGTPEIILDLDLVDPDLGQDAWFPYNGQIWFRDSFDVEVYTPATGSIATAIDCTAAIGTLAWNGSDTIYYDCGLRLFKASLVTPTPTLVADLEHELLFDELIYGGGYLHWRHEDPTNADEFRFCSVPATGGTPSCNATVVASTGQAADCLHTSTTWTGSGGQFYCFGNNTEGYGYAIKTFGSSGGATIVATNVEPFGYSRMVLIDDYLYFLSGTKEPNVHYFARVKTDGTGREFLGQQDMYGMSGVAKHGAQTFYCGVVEEASLDSWLLVNTP